jgi:hypothetical protein
MGKKAVTTAVTRKGKLPGISVCLLLRGVVGGVAIRYGMDSPGIEFRWKREFSAPVQTCRGAQWILSLFPGGQAALTT